MTNELRDRVLDAILAFEGGLSDHPADGGGRTHFGLTKPFLREVTGRGWSDEEVDALTVTQARQVYALWMHTRRLDMLPEHFPLALAVADFAVHSGIRTALKAVQRRLGVVPDGIAGAETQGAWHRLTPSECNLMAGAVIEARLEHLARIVQADSTQACFLLGWLRRVGALVRTCLA